MSAFGGLAGSLLYSYVQSRVLAVLLGSLLLFAGITQFFGLLDKMRFGNRMAWVSGVVSGIFGGMVGNQGGIRSAALLGFGLSREAFVATATGIALLVDGARVPVYLIQHFDDISRLWLIVLLGTIGGVVGTFQGTKILKKIPDPVFKKIVSVLIFLLGVWTLFKTR